MNSDPDNAGKPSRMPLLLVAALVSLTLKMLIATTGNNYDMESFRIVADTVLQGKTVYAETHRYNYGPIWAYVAAATRYIQIHVFANDSLGLFHMLLAALLGYVDVLIGLALASRFSTAAGFVFLLNPVSLLITGYHSQFDNLAVLFALYGSLLLFGDPPARRWHTALGIVLLGLSLGVKHILIFFPIWLLFRKEFDWKKKLLFLTLPYGIFLAMFLPFVFNGEACRGIAHNVFSYSAYMPTGLYTHLVGLIVPPSFFESLFGWIPVFSGFKFVWLVTMILTGWLLRKTDGRQFLLYYLVAMCVFSPQIVDQYMAIPLIACAVFCRSWLVWGYILTATLYLVGCSPDNIGCVFNIPPLTRILQSTGMTAWRPFTLLLIFLVVAIVRLWRQKAPAVEK
jgi:hypothetical protein